MSSSSMVLSLNEVAALGALHAEREAAQDLDGVMATLNDNPVYEYPTLGKQFSGSENALRFYQHFFANYSPNVVGSTLIGQWVNENSVAQEYVVDCSFNGVKESHRVLGVLLVEGDKLSGERIFANEQVIKRMIGPMFDQLVVL